MDRRPDPDGPLVSLVITGEQSNTSLVFGDQLILKVFRRLTPGSTPTWRSPRAWPAPAASTSPRQSAWLESRSPGSRPTLGMLQTFLRTAPTAGTWPAPACATCTPRPTCTPTRSGGDFAAEAYRLGPPRPRCTRPGRALPTDILDRRRRRRPGGGDDPTGWRTPRSRCPTWRRTPPACTRRSTDLARRPAPVPVQRIHGDLHLGRCCARRPRWVLIDFEGEPASRWSERPRCTRRCATSPACCAPSTTRPGTCSPTTRATTAARVPRGGVGRPQPGRVLRRLRRGAPAQTRGTTPCCCARSRPTRPCTRSSTRRATAGLAVRSRCRRSQRLVE